MRRRHVSETETPEPEPEPDAPPADEPPQEESLLDPDAEVPAPPDG
jgi:hypothetical protein